MKSSRISRVSVLVLVLGALSGAASAADKGVGKGGGGKTADDMAADAKLSPIKVSPDPVASTQSFKVWFKAPRSLKKGWWWRVQVTLGVEDAAGGGECERFVLAPNESYGQKVTSPRRKGKRVTVDVALPTAKKWCPVGPRRGVVRVMKQNRSLEKDGDGAQGVFPAPNDLRVFAIAP